jgi:glycosyltransferase involved in cell wall biosynthesis
LRLLHVFAGPFPSSQGTQVLVGQTVDLLAEAGREAHLLTYAHGARSAGDAAPGDAAGRVRHHRIPDLPRFRNLRSGPSCKKIALDLSLALKVRRLLRVIAPDVVHAHHYEALFACRIADPAGCVPLVFHAHALFEPELAGYLPALPAPLIARLGGALDRRLPPLADHTIALGDHLRDALVRAGLPASRITTIPPPFLAPRFMGDTPGHEQSAASDRLELHYSGNLDAYQEAERLLDALAALAPDIRASVVLSVTTSSDPAWIRDEARRRGLERDVRFEEHCSGRAAWRRLLQSDAVLIPRTGAGGYPIKLVNALGAGKPIVVDRRVAPQLAHEREALVVDWREPSEAADAIERLVREPALRKKLSAGASEAAATLHDPGAFTDRLIAVYEHLLSNR